nr:hypothetical protein CFP56_71183 [Quercus suber]
MHDLEHFSCRSWTAVALGSSVAGSVGTPVVNSTGLTLPIVPILGAAPAVSPITPLVPALSLAHLIPHTPSLALSD